MITKLTWRNIWRNKRRTMITMASVFFAVVLSTLLMSIKEGVYTGMIDSVIGSYLGFGQIHQQGYWDEKTPDNSFAFNRNLQQVVLETPGVKAALPRVEGVAMAVSTDITRISFVVGMDMKGEQKFNRMNERVTKGTYLNATDKAVMIGEGLASYLQLGINDTLILLGQGYHGAAAAGKYPVKGLIKFGSPELSKQLVILPLAEAQSFYSMEGLVNIMSLHFTRSGDNKSVIYDLKQVLGNNYEVMGWRELMPDLDNLIKTDRVEGYVFMFILYMVASFGIFGTILMMLTERKREFGVLVSIGMKRSKLAVMVWLEVMMISVLGALAGMAGAFPVCWYFYVNPVSLGDELKKVSEEYGMEAVLRSTIEPYVFWEQGLSVLAISLLISVYPFVKLWRLKAMQAMRS